MTIERVTLNDPEAQSADPVADNVAALKTLFPAAVADGRIDFDTLRQLLGEEVDDGDERYGLNWPGRRRARRLALTPSTGTLRPAREDSVEWDTTRNLMIEGDNLEVLKLLQKSYSGAVKLVYIDPPYNTGNDFVYPDDFTDSLGNYLSRTGQIDDDGRTNTTNPSSSGRFHSSWLDMLYPRILAARNLLRQDGLILMYLDDAEIANGLHLLSEVFGEENKVATLVIDRNRKNDARFFSVGHEYILVWARSKELLVERDTIFRAGKEGVTDVRAEFTRLKDENGEEWDDIASKLIDFYKTLPSDEARKSVSRFRKVDEKGPYRDDGNINWPGGGGPRYEIIHPDTKRPVKTPTSGWRYPTAERFWEEVGNGRIVFGADENTVPRVRTNLFEADTQVLPSVWFSYAQTSTNDLTELMDSNRVFDNPKPITDVRKLVSYLTDREGTIIDFFAGSGTTGHAVMAQNADDGGDRRHILVQLPEVLDPAIKEQNVAAKFCDKLGKPRNIAELTKERLRRAAEKIKADHPDTQVDLGFRVYKLASSNLSAWNPSDDLAADLLAAADNIVQGRTEDDLLTELLLKQGIDLTEPMVTETIAGAPVHAMGGGVLVVCLAPVTAAGAEALADGIADWIIALNPVSAATIFFKDAGFENDVAKANVAAILDQRLDDKLLKVRSL